MVANIRGVAAICTRDRRLSLRRHSYGLRQPGKRRAGDADAWCVHADVAARRTYPGAPRSWQLRLSMRERFGLFGGERLASSEEHTSELQSLMRTPYAVLCLKKKRVNKNINIYQA